VVRLDGRGRASSRDGSKSGGRQGFQRRFEGSAVGEALIGAFVALFLLVGIAWNLPASEIKNRLVPVLKPIAIAAGADQVWQMYAPNPIRRLEVVEVHVTMADGSDRVWTLQRGDLVIGPFTWYRWQKLKEQLVREPPIRAEFARWAVRELAPPPNQPAFVEMALRTTDMPPPGKNSAAATTLETLYSEDLTGHS
jgi:hypothetical protein